MPWGPSDAGRHTRKARGGSAARQWSHVANSMLSRGYSEGRAIRAANATVKRRHKRRSRRA